MNKIKSLAVAVALAITAGSAHADIANGATGNGELFLSVWDKVNAVSYIRDLGITINDFGTLNAPTQTLIAPGSFVNYVDSAAGSSMSWGTSGDAAWATFISGKTASQIDAFVWDVYAADSVGNTAAHAQRYLTTTNADLSLWSTTNGTQQSSSQIAGWGGIANQHLDYINLDTTQTVGQGAADTTANGSGVYTSGDLFGYVGNSKLDNWGTNAQFFTTATVGATLDFYYVTRNSGSASEGVAYQYGNMADDAQFLLTNDGTLTYNVAAVPEAETWAMFGAGLLMVGAIARRRMAS